MASTHSQESTDELLVRQLLDDVDTEMGNDERDVEAKGEPFDTTEVLHKFHSASSGRVVHEQAEYSNDHMTLEPPERGDTNNQSTQAAEPHCLQIIEAAGDPLRPMDSEVALCKASTTPPSNYPPVIYPSVQQGFNEDGGVNRPAQMQNTNDQLENISTASAQAPTPGPESSGGDPESTNDNDDSNDETMGEDGASSEMSEGGEFHEELQDALDDSHFSFSGSFYHAGLLSSSPNPCLHISDIGIVGLPLSDRDAKAIVSCATLAPFGRGERTVVDKDVRHTWEIEPAKISFENSLWEKYVQDVICTEACKSLGVSTGTTRLHMEFYKLLLYEKGSHFLPHQDTQKANGMFATVIIVLPSAYTGGQVILSHSSKQKKIDFATNSLTSTALLAWYTDVKHEVKEITSGYRLALSYNLIHVPSPGVPIPTLPDMSDSLVVLRRVLKKWRDGKYDEVSGNGVIAYLLEHQYSPANIKVGIKALKGSDAHKVKHIRSVAEELGFTVGIANLEHHVSGPGDDDGGGYYSRGRYDYYDEDEDEDEDEDTPGMAEVSVRTTSITGLVDLSGTALLPTGKVEIEDGCFVPRDAFDDETPDDTEYEGYMGNGAGEVEFWYRRTALVLIQKSELDNICYEAGGVSYALERLKKSSTVPPTTEDRLWAQRLLQHDRSLSKTHVTTLMDYSLRWRDLGIWKGVMKCPASTLQEFSDALLRAWQIFSFENVRLSFEEVLARSTDLKEKMTFIYSLPPQSTEVNHQAIRAWCQKESDKILSSYGSGNIRDIPTIMFIISEGGLEAFSRTMMASILKRTRNYSFLLALRAALADARQSILTRGAKPSFTCPSSMDSMLETASVINNATATPNSDINLNLSPTGALLNNLLKHCLTLAASQWSDTQEARLAHGYHGYGYRPVQAAPTHSKVDRIIEIVNLAVSSNEMDVIKTLFTEVLKAPGNTASKFNQIYTPLIPRLKTLLANMNGVDIYMSPFIDLLQVIIGSYLRDVLGQRGQMLNAGLRQIGCGCGDCQQLDKFIMDPTTSTTTIRVVKNRRIHLEQRIAAARDICTYETIRNGSPHGVKVTKRPEVVAASMWGHRQQNARNFLAAVGSDSVIKRIMGARYAEVVSALQGTKVFGPVRSVIETVQNTRHTQATSAAPGPSRVATNAPHVPTPAPAPSDPAAPRLGGTKRKNVPTRPLIQLGPVIDLTGDDSS